MRTSSKALIPGLLFLLAGILPLTMIVANASAQQTASTNSWNILDTNGEVWWWITEDRGTMYFTNSGVIEFTPAEKHANDVFWANDFGPEWFGTFGITAMDENGTLVPNNQSISNVSNAEIGAAMGFSVKGYMGGLVSPTTNWTAVFEYLDGAVNASNNENLTRVLQGGVAKITYTDANQDTVLHYQASTGVLVFANTTVFGFRMVLEHPGYMQDIPGFSTVLVLLAAGTATGAIAIVSARKARKK